MPVHHIFVSIRGRVKVYQLCIGELYRGINLRVGTLHEFPSSVPGVPVCDSLALCLSRVGFDPLYLSRVFSRQEKCIFRCLIFPKPKNGKKKSVGVRTRASYIVQVG